jgi:hypothetical protein
MRARTFRDRHPLLNPFPLAVAAVTVVLIVAMLVALRLRTDSPSGQRLTASAPPAALVR